MILRELYLKDFRNYEELLLTELDARLNLIIGDNAQGKTNIVEAIYFLSCGRSFRQATEERLIRENADAAKLRAVYETASGRGKLEAALFNGKNRSVRLNGVPVRRMSEVIGRLNTVIFAPEDMRTVKESPSLRRRLIDIEISKLFPSYYVALQRYSAALREKNRLLKEPAPDAALIDVYNIQLAEQGSVIIEKREQFLKCIAAHAARFHSVLTDDAETLNLKYRPSADLGDIGNSLLERMTLNFNRECEQRTALIGPHREDFDIVINGRDARLMASQGQQRTAMISIKLACAEAANDFCEERPVLLLDDVFSELDKNRAERLMHLSENFQVFITSTAMTGIHTPENAKIIKVSNGRIF